MRKSILYCLGLLAGVAGLNGMDTEERVSFFEGPLDVQKVIIDVALGGKETSYEMANSRLEKLYIPYTLRPINPVVCTTSNNPKPDSWEPKEGAKILLDHQLWLSSHLGFFKVRLEHDSENNHDTIKFKHDDDIERLLFDGINKKRCAIFVLIAPAARDGSYVYFLRQSPIGAGRFEQEGIFKEKLFSLPGCIQSAMLHPDENRIMYSVKSQNTQYSDAINADTDKKECYDLTIIDVDDNDKKKTIASKTLNFLIRKTIYLGVNRYLGLTLEGKLVHLWLDKDNKLQHSMINLKKYDDQTKEYATSDSVVKDIAVDDACRTADGVRPRIAYITSKGEVFVMDFGCFKKPAPLLNKVVENAASVFRLFYDKGELAVLYANAQGIFQDFVRWPDNLGALYLKTVLAQKERKNKHS